MGKSRRRKVSVNPLIETLLQVRISEVNLISHSLTFNSFKLAKFILKELNQPGTGIRACHQQVKAVLKNWVKKGYCTELIIEGPPSSKMLCQFTEETIEKFRVESSIPLP